MIKAAVIIERSDIALGGAERSVFELTSQLAMLGIKLTILAAKGRSAGKNTKVLCNDRHGKRVPLNVFEDVLRKHLALNHYDIVHSTLPFAFADIYQPRGGTYPEAIRRNAASYKSKIIYSLKMITHYANTRRSALMFAEKQMFQTFNNCTVAALSDYVKDQFKKHYALNDERIVVIRNGVKIDKQFNAEEAYRLKTQIFARLGIHDADEPAIFLFAANNFRLKGLTPLIEALAKAKKTKTQRPPYLVIAGNDSSGKYRVLAAKHNVSDRIVFLGKVRHIRNILSISDTAILPTYYDPCSRFILEALAAAKPVITTAFNGASEAFIDTRHGRIINSPDDVNTMAEAICYYSNTENIEQTARAIVDDGLKEKVSITAHAGQIIELYKTILNNRKKQ